MFRLSHIVIHTSPTSSCIPLAHKLLFVLKCKYEIYLRKGGLWSGVRRCRIMAQTKRWCDSFILSSPKLKKKHTFLIIIRVLMLKCVTDESKLFCPASGTGGGGVWTQKPRRNKKVRSVRQSYWLRSNFWSMRLHASERRGARRLGVKELVMLSTRSISNGL